MQIRAVVISGCAASHFAARFIAATSVSYEQVVARPLALIVVMVAGAVDGPLVTTAALPPLLVPFSADPSVYMEIANWSSLLVRVFIASARMSSVGDDFVEPPSSLGEHIHVSCSLCQGGDDSSCKGCLHCVVGRMAVASLVAACLQLDLVLSRCLTDFSAMLHLGLDSGNLSDFSIALTDALRAMVR